MLLSVGSGTIADIGKVVSARLDLPHVIVQTAASVNGFSDDQSVLLVDGVKRTTPSRWPDRLLIDLDVIARAPVELNRAGLGDLLATYTAPADWRLAQLVGQDDSYSPFAVSLARDTSTPCSSAPTRSTAPSPTRSRSCARRWSSAGSRWASPAGPRPARASSTPSATCWRWPAPRRCTARAVGALSVLAAMLWARVRTVASAGGLRALRFPTAAEMEPRVRAAFAELDPSGAAGDECWRGYAAKLERWNAARDELTTLWERWPDAEFDGLLASPERLVAALRAARAPVRLTQLGVRDATARWALAHGHLMRDRFTVADLAFFMGIWEASDVDALLVVRRPAGSRAVIEFVFMLTRDDVTVADAADVLPQRPRQRACATSASRTSGRRRRCCARSPTRRTRPGWRSCWRSCRSSREEELRSLRAAREIGVDWVLGGTHAREGVEILDGVRYCPFPGTIEGHPSVLTGLDRRDRRARRAS